MLSVPCANLYYLAAVIWPLTDVSVRKEIGDAVTSSKTGVMD